MKRSCRVGNVLQFPTAHRAEVFSRTLVGTGETWVMKQPLRLRGISGDVKGKVWESESLLRAGRLGTLEIVLDDSSVSRRHAEVRNVENGWWVRDLGQHQRHLRQRRPPGQRRTAAPLSRHHPVRQSRHDGRNRRSGGVAERSFLRPNPGRSLRQFFLGRRFPAARFRPQSQPAPAIN